mmetsp:Transcript_11679/g.16556  ORF Transcript_11679/g.16556 Transcript_11679/m.16556 type:complete len:1117 (-) Transcript_11679:392-3742(-)|eukprot:CAMPEP_0184855674 /NCGR_PEP_ID=MMETSP0580-20130426/831_1 /TAXON_ID=1118495 /ORGANISM="Dactyliosolen fragilissimus" /LENGTH=1116 /DNA_ID=CAMNT_0027350239 /DNA_START=229 /DNA_END=3579 /DNA_ORIENTATION=-
MGKKEIVSAFTPQDDGTSWHALTVEETVSKLGLSSSLPKEGLNSGSSQERLSTFGPNKMTEQKKETLLEKIWKQVSNVLVCILVVVALVSAARAIAEHAKSDPDSTTILTSWVQVGLITGVITINTFIGILQEGSAEKAAEALKNMLSADARVVREGKEMMVPSYDVVPGDVIILSLGDRIPADMRMFEVSNLACGEAALTGESVPIDKTTDAILPKDGLNAEQTPLGDRHNMCFSATLVAQGAGKGIAIATGDFTQIGTINKLVSQVEKKKTNVLEQIDKVSKLLAFLIGIATLATFFVAKFASNQGWFEAISTALVCCVAMVPEGLEAIVTLTYAWAVTNMAHQNAIVRALPAVETLGSVTVICSDKTGTLTQNIMSLTAFVTSNAHYKFDVDSKDRVPTNFIRTDSYMAERAQHALKKSAKSVIKDGGTNSGEKRKGRLTDSNHFAIDSSLHPTDDDDQVEVSIHEKDDVMGTGSGPFPEGSSPDFEFVGNALKCGVLCSKCVLGENGTREGEIGNPTEISILRAAYFSGIDVEELKATTPIVAEVPFSSEYKFMATVHDENPSSDMYTCYVKGAPDRMVKLCANQAKAGVISDLEPCDEKYWIEKIAILSSHGLRVLALTRADIPKTSVTPGENLQQEFVNGREPKKWLTMVGLCAIMDPPRPECVQAIAEAHGAGVRVAMITGDHKDTATAIGHMLGLVDEKYHSAVTGPELDEMSDEEIKVAVMNHSVFARASPQNKIRIVKALQAQGQISSMTGDGVNDAPALKAADMGVAMGKEGTDVAREASEMILADDNFATIVLAVREGRVVWDNLRKVLVVNTPINNAQGMSVLFGLAFGLKDSPLSPIQVLYSNLICAITLGFVTAIEPAEEGIMSFPPRKLGKRLIGRFLLLRILLGTFTLTALVVASVFWLKGYNEDGCEYTGEINVEKYNFDAHTYFYDEDFNVNVTAPSLPSNYIEDVHFCNPKYDLEHLRSLAFNVLDFGAVSVTLSARFSYNSSFHPRIFFNNKYCWYSIAIVVALQFAITYIPGLNSTIFLMKPMNGIMWAICFSFMAIVFAVMEVEKAIRRILRDRKYDTDDLEPNPLFDDDDEPDGNIDLPKGASKLNLVAMEN